jgi:hypothetical protein
MREQFREIGGEEDCKDNDGEDDYGAVPAGGDVGRLAVYD